MGLSSADVAKMIAGGLDLEASQAEKVRQFRAALGFSTNLQLPTRKERAAHLRMVRKAQRQMRNSQGPTPDQTMGNRASTSPRRDRGR